jgi:hypothetical protein
MPDACVKCGKPASRIELGEQLNPKLANFQETPKVVVRGKPMKLVTYCDECSPRLNRA